MKCKQINDVRPLWLTLKQACAFFQVHEKTMVRWIQQGRIRNEYVKKIHNQYRFKREAVESGRFLIDDEVENGH